MSRKNRKSKEVEPIFFEEPVVVAPVESAPQKKVINRMSASWKVMNNCAPTPVAKPADFVQLTPIVQPIPLVPYSTQTQPILTFIEEDDE